MTFLKGIAEAMSAETRLEHTHISNKRGERHRGVQHRARAEQATRCAELRDRQAALERWLSAAL